MFNYLFFKTRIHLVFQLLLSLSFSKWLNLFRNFSAYILKLNTAGRTPSVLTIILTYKCNFSCIMCQKSSLDSNAYTSNPNDINFNALEKLLRENAKHLSIVRLHGGEPTYYKDFTKVISLLDELNLKYTLITNGSLLTTKLSKQLLKNCLLVSLSIDSADKDIYAHMREGGKLEQITKNISTLNQIKKQYKKKVPYLNIAATMFTFNIRGLSDLVMYCSENKIQSISVSEGSYYNTSQLKETDFIKNDVELVEECVDKAQITADELGIVLRLNSQILYWNKRENQLIANRSRITSCFNFYFSIVLSPNFDVQLCPLSFPIGNLNKTSLSEIWNSKESNILKARKLINSKNEFPATCRYCNDYNKSFNQSKEEYSYVNYQKENKYWKK